MRADRPRGVTLLAGASVIVGLGLLILAFTAIYVLRLLPQALAIFVEFPEGLLGLAAAVAAIQFLIAYGLWTLRPWARLGVIGFSIVGLAIGMLTLPFGFAAVLLNTANVWYLTEPRVRAAFRAGTRSPPKP